MTASSTQLARRAEQVRERLSDRLEDLRYHVSPGTVVGDLLGVNPRTWGADNAVALLAQQARRNPIACLLIAAGVGWLMFSEPRGPRRQVSTVRRKSRRPKSGAKSTRRLRRGQSAAGRRRK
jgi:hypothetical protein